MTSVDFTKKAVVLVTGASRGIGRAISLELARNLNHNSILILIARSATDLEQTNALIQEVDKSLTVLTYPLDLATADLSICDSLFDKIITSIDVTGIEFGMIFHNAGSTGDLKPAVNLTSIDEWRHHFDLNLFSAAVLNSAFLRKIRPIAPQLVVVNITSLCGRSPFANLAMYGTSKAAREIFFKVLAVEEKKVFVLNYSPGPVDTEMFEGIIEKAESEEVRGAFRGMKEKGILRPEQTVTKLLGLLEKGTYKSGETIDYFDDVKTESS